MKRKNVRLKQARKYDRYLAALQRRNCEVFFPRPPSVYYTVTGTRKLPYVSYQDYVYRLKPPVTVVTVVSYTDDQLNKLGNSRTHSPYLEPPAELDPEVVKGLFG